MEADLTVSLLMNVKQPVLIVDACNILHADPHYRQKLSMSLDVAVSELANQVQVIHDFGNWEVYLVVDGQGLKLTKQLVGNNDRFQVIYAPSGTSADTIIEGWVIRLEKGDFSVTVATEDRAIQHTAFAHGGEAIDHIKLSRLIDRFGDSQIRSLKKLKQPRFGNSLDL